MRRSGPRWVAALVVGAITATACSGGDDGGGGGEPALADPGDCVTVDVASSPEKLELLGDLADSFNDSDAARLANDDCAFVRVQNKSSGAAEQLLANGWDKPAGTPDPDEIAVEVEIPDDSIVDHTADELEESDF